MLALGAVFLFAELPMLPVVIWDESRLACNAMEMRQTGLSLITTYDFRPDLWNTKPPLLIWLMDASMAIFGPSPWALRLPSAAAALATAALVMGFSWRMTRSALVTVAAGLLLIASPGFFSKHVALTGDYDALLYLLTTGYALSAFFNISRVRPRPAAVLATAALIAGAVLTKGVAGLVPGVGLLAYVVLTRRWMRLLTSPVYLLGGALAGVVAGGYYWLREAASTGYLQAVWNNELVGRYVGTIKGHARQYYYYLVMVFTTFGFSIGPAPLPLLAVYPKLTGKRRAAARLCLCMTAGLLVVLTLGQTKIRWYAAPIYPFLAVFCAITLEAWLKGLSEQPRGWLRLTRRRAEVATGVAAAILVAVVIPYRYLYVPHTLDTPTTRYGALLAQLRGEGARKVYVVDGGEANTENMINYTPQLHYYALVFREHGLQVQEAISLSPASVRSSDVVATCDGRWTAQVSSLGRNGSRVRDCVAVRMRK